MIPKGRQGSPLYKSNFSPSLDEDQSKTNNGEIVIQMPQISQSQLMISAQDRYISSRADAVANIERTITELQGIFQQLATLVAEQQEMVDRIDNNIDHTSSHVENAQLQLLHYLSNVSSNRWLIFKIFILVIFFLFIFVVFFI